jgi:hypothetical protein
MSEDFRLEIALPLDPDGFIRRACPECGRHFKWFVDRGREGESAEDLVHFCPYCRHRGEDWLTDAQGEYVTAKGSAAAAAEFLGDSDAIRFEPDPAVAALKPPREPGDMERRESPCHPEEPVKVLDGWTGLVHCLACGETI